MTQALDILPVEGLLSASTKHVGAAKMGHWIKASATQPVKLTQISGTHKVEREKQFPKAVL